MMHPTFLVALSVINVLYALMLMYAATKVDISDKMGRAVMVWILLLVGVLAVDTAITGHVVINLP